MHWPGDTLPHKYSTLPHLEIDGVATTLETITFTQLLYINYIASPNLHKFFSPIVFAYILVDYYLSTTFHLLLFIDYLSLTNFHWLLFIDSMNIWIWNPLIVRNPTIVLKFNYLLVWNLTHGWKSHHPLVQEVTHCTGRDACWYNHFWWSSLKSFFSFARQVRIMIRVSVYSRS